MPTLDIFQDDAFSLTNLTAAINEIPMPPTQIQDSGLFQSEGIDSLALMIEKQTGKNSLVAYTPRGGPGETVSKDGRNVRSFAVPHIQRDDTIMADEVQGVRAFGSLTETEMVMNKVAKRMAKHQRDIAMTIEHQRAGAMKGIVLDKFGNTIVNLYTAFEVAVPDPISMELDVDATVVRKISDQVAYAVEDALEGETVQSIEAWCGRDFWDQLINHKDVRDIWKAAQDRAALLGKTPDEIQIGSVLYKRYKISPSSKAASAAGGGFIPIDKARVFPVGVPDMFITRFGPGDYIDTVNADGLPFYAKQWLMPNEKGVSMEVQSNPISLCTRPGALIELTIT